MILSNVKVGIVMWHRLTPRFWLRVPDELDDSRHVIYASAFSEELWLFSFGVMFSEQGFQNVYL